MSSAAEYTAQRDEADAAGLDYKAQLDEAAKSVKNRPDDSSAQEGGLLARTAEKAGKVLGKSQDEATPPPPPGSKAPGPPERPDHDAQIEEFVRDQHRSRAEDGTLVG